MEVFSGLLALCGGNPPVTGGFPSQRPVTRSFDISFDLRLNGRANNRDAGDLRRHCAHYDCNNTSSFKFLCLSRISYDFCCTADVIQNGRCDLEKSRDISSVKSYVINTSTTAANPWIRILPYILYRVGIQFWILCWGSAKMQSRQTGLRHHDGGSWRYNTGQCQYDGCKWPGAI